MRIVVKVVKGEAYPLRNPLDDVMVNYVSIEYGQKWPGC